MAARTFSTKFSSAGKLASQSKRDAYWSTKLQLTISDAKKLPSSSENNYFAAISVDDEIVGSTSTAWRVRQANPFFGEEFQLDLANDFKAVRVYMYHQEKPDDPIGKVDFERTSFTETPIVEGWFPLIKPCPQTESFGEVEVELLLSETETGLDHLTCTVLQARDLCGKDTTTKCDSFAKVVLDAQQESTEKIKACRYPQYNKTVSFERAKLGPTLIVQVCDGGIVLGESVINLKDLEQDIPNRKWYRLMPNKAAVEKFQDGYGSIRISWQYTNELILPLASYKSLIGLLESTARTEAGIRMGIVGTLEELLGDQSFSNKREQVATMLIRILLERNHSTIFLKGLNDMEIAKSRESYTLFRGNSMATKCTDQFMKIAGLQYLHQTIKSTIDEIFRDRKYCEIDPTRLDSKYSEKDIPKHTAILAAYIDGIFTHIFNSVTACPQPMRMMFKHLQLGARQNPSLGADAAYTVVSGFLFLRFFAAAVLSPKLFGMRDSLADETTTRTLTLVAKALQSVGNLGSSLSSGKEAYMTPLHPTIKKNLPGVKRFIDGLCSIDNAGQEEVKQLTSAIVARTEAQIRGEWDGDIVPKSFKKRFLKLTGDALTISKDGVVGSAEIVVPMSKLNLLEVLETSVFDKKYVIVVQSKANVVYLCFNNKLEQVSWLTGMRKASRSSLSVQPSSHHPGNAGKGKWSCCKRRLSPTTSRLVGGCGKCHSTIVVDPFADNAASEVWAHKLFAMLLDGKPKLEAKYTHTSPTDAAKKENLKKLYTVLDDIHLAHLLHQDAG
eukprot:m.95765 g.95765  ORF g.95765 m.95765 type:complete len:783 (-) comp26847_c0_seq1:209-2557(-)